MKKLQNKNKTIIALYETSGTFSRLYYELGYDVIQVDLQNKGKSKNRWQILNTDCRLMEHLSDKNVVGVISHPPCTVFAGSGNRWRYEEKSLPSTNDIHSNLLEQKLQDALSMIDVVFRIVHVTRPEFWFIENPVGKLSKFIGKHQFSFNPYEFASYRENPEEHLDLNFEKTCMHEYVGSYEDEAFTKRTLLWGKFNCPKKNTSTNRENGFHEIKPEYVEMKGGKRMSKMHYSSLKLDKTERMNIRSKTATGFAIAFVKENRP
ncbi:hypothetical protein N9Q69_01285 [bacterium]|nr:hypothetical protein [bacterium]